MHVPHEPPLTAARRQRFGSPRARVAIVGVLLRVAFIAAFDGVWLRPLIQHHVHERSGRRIDCDALHLGFDRALQPTVTLRNLVVQNAPWAGPRPRVRAAEFGFTLSWASLFGDRATLTRLSLVDAESSSSNCRPRRSRRRWNYPPTPGCR